MDQDNSMRNMAALWVKSQSIVSAYISSNVFDSHGAEDIIQETAKAVAEKFHTFDTSRPFTPWVLAIARNQLLNYYRGQSRNKFVLNEQALMSCCTAFERVESELEDRRNALKICIEQIVGKSASVLHMRYEEEMPIKDIATNLGIASSTVSVMLFRVRSTLERCIRKQLALGVEAK